MLDDARNQALIGQIIGFALGANFQEGVAAATSAKGADIAFKSLLELRIERSADQVAVNPNQTRITSTGLLKFFERLQYQELLCARVKTCAYPLTQTDHFVGNTSKIALFGNELPERVKTIHDRMVAKLRFHNPPSQTLAEYLADDTAVSARYARTMAYYRDSRLDQALKLIDGLVEQAPKDPYFHELRGQILFKHGRLSEALPAYERAVKLSPQQPLLRVGLAHVQIEINKPDLIKSAIGNIEEALRYDRFMPLSWHLAATAYGRNGQLGVAALALAEHNLLLGRLMEARGQANKAMRILRSNSPSWLRAQDIEATAKRARERERR